MTGNHSNSGTLNFEVDAGLLFELGERLVARSSIALGELIKNAYDADATQVTVLLENVRGEKQSEAEGENKEERENGAIIVEDNGSGMTFEQVCDNWMRIATDDKLRNPVSPHFGRRRAGAKGIGRFAARRLADTLSLYSVASREDGAKEQVYVRFEWGRAFTRGQNLSSVPIAYERKTVDNDRPTGVTLLLEDVRDIWTENDVAALRKDLLSLTSPFPNEKVQKARQQREFEPDPGFSIKLEAREFPEYEGELGEHFLEAAWGELGGWVDESGKAHYHLKVRETEESLNYNETEARFRSLVGADLRVYYFVYRKDLFRDFDFGAQDAIRYGREHGGVRIYLDGFRVYGYGEKGEDWLRLNELRAERERRPDDLTLFLRDEVAKLRPQEPFLRMPGNNQLFGAVFLSQSHHISQDASDKRERIELNVGRDRLVENEAFGQLRYFLRTGIYWMTIQYARIQYAQQVAESEETTPWAVKPIAPLIGTALQNIERTVKASGRLPTQQKARIIEAVATIREAISFHDEENKRRENQRISEISMLRVLASVGTTISFLNHQLRAIENSLGGIAALFEIYADQIEVRARDAYIQNVRDLWTWHRYIKQQVDELGFLLGLRARSDLEPYNLRQVVDDVAKPLESYRMDFGIEFENQVPVNLVSPPMYLAEIHAILVNIFTNALKAVRQQPERKIMVRGGRRTHGIYIQMLDTGKGLDISPESAFEPFRTTSEPDPVLGEGTGLGLYVVRALLRAYSGTARFVDVAPPWRTCIEIELPRK